MSVLKSDYKDITWENIPFPKLILKCAEEKFGDRVAMIQDETGVKMTYSEMAKNIRSIGAALYAQGFRKGDVMLIFSTNNILYPCLYHGAALIGMLVTSCNPLYTTEDLVRQLEDADVVAITTIAAFCDKTNTAAEKYGKLKKKFLFDGTGDEDGFTPVKELLQVDPSNCPDVEMDMKDVVCMPYSSGTTGFPKGVHVTNNGLVATMTFFSQEAFNCFRDENDVCLGVVPFYHALGMGIYMGYAFYMGVTVVVQSRFDPEKFLRAIEKYKVTNMHIVPPIAVIMTKHPLMDTLDVSSLQHINIAAAPLANTVLKELNKKLPHVCILQLYGMTETLVLTCGVFSEECPPGSVGKIVNNTQIMVVDPETGDLCGPNKSGEIWGKGPGLMAAYHGNQTATENFFSEDGFAKTGDIGYFDENGYFYIIDRLKELIKYNAYQVPPAELESILLSHPSIADAAVIGVPDEKAGELPKAYVVKKPGCESLTEEEVAKYVEERVAPQKKLRGGVEFRTAIPKLPSGKILRRVLRSEAAAARNMLDINKNVK